MNQSSPPKIYSIIELTLSIRCELERNFDNIWVEGEVSNLKTPSSGHIYFTLNPASLGLLFLKTEPDT